MASSSRRRKLTPEEIRENLREEQLTLGQRIADRVAEFGGSWGFIISFFSFIVLWIVLNTFLLLNKAYDPYPYILLNLILSCLAALQAPVIMMSQNRMEEKDRARAIRDLEVNLHAEAEIHVINDKLDALQLQHEAFQKEMLQLLQNVNIKK